jgi:hypothetical protein
MLYFFVTLQCNFYFSENLFDTLIFGMLSEYECKTQFFIFSRERCINEENVI